MAIILAAPAVVPRADFVAASAGQEWAFDLEATQHLTLDGVAREGFELASAGTALKIADGSFVEVIGYDKLELLVK